MACWLIADESATRSKIAAARRLGVPLVLVAAPSRSHKTEAVTIAAALSIAETGHLVLATLHTNDASQTVDRILDAFPAGQAQQARVQLSACLSGVIYQQLLPAVGGGRVAAFEILIATSAIRSLIKEGKTNQIRNAMQTSLRKGSQSLERSLIQLLQSGLVTEQDARARSLYPQEIAAGKLPAN